MGDVLALARGVREHEPLTIRHQDGDVTFTALSVADTSAHRMVTVKTDGMDADGPVFLVLRFEAGRWVAHSLDTASSVVHIPPPVEVWLEDVVATARQAAS
jgi:hypothetical protein